MKSCRLPAMSMYQARERSQSKKSIASSNCFWVLAKVLFRSPPNPYVGSHQSHLQRVSSVYSKLPYWKRCPLFTMNRCVSALASTWAKNGSRRASIRRDRFIASANSKSSPEYNTSSTMRLSYLTRSGSVIIASIKLPNLKAFSLSPYCVRG